VAQLDAKAEKPQRLSRVGDFLWVSYERLSIGTTGMPSYEPCEVTESLPCKVGGKDNVQAWWEFTVTDDEIAAFTESIPNYLDSYSS
jgi:hypothetical protein